MTSGEDLEAYGHVLHIVNCCDRLVGLPGPAPVSAGGFGSLRVGRSEYLIERRWSQGTDRELMLASRGGRQVLIKTYGAVELDAWERAPRGIAPALIDADERYLVREYLDGVHLNAAVGMLDHASRVRIVHWLNESVRRLHGEGIVHGALRAWNVWLPRDENRIRVVSFERSIVDGCGFDPAVHGDAHRADPREIDLEALGVLARFVSAGVRQPHHPVAWRQTDGEAERLRQQRTTIVRMLSTYAGWPATPGRAETIWHIRKAGGEDLFELADRFQGSTWSSVDRTLALRTRIVINEESVPLVPGTRADLVTISLGAPEIEAYTAAIHRTAQLGPQRALFVFPACIDREVAASLLVGAARRSGRSLILEAGGFTAAAGAPDYVLVSFEPSSGAVRLAA